MFSHDGRRVPSWGSVLTTDPTLSLMVVFRHALGQGRDENPEDNRNSSSAGLGPCDSCIRNDKYRVARST